MAVVDFAELKTLVPAGRLMALDVGTKTIGVATSDALRMLATPLTTLKRGKLAVDLAALAELPVVFQDERLSTAAVTRGMIDDYDMSRAKRAERVDAAAAAWILESALARLK